jgi:hypothetical protein
MTTNETAAPATPAPEPCCTPTRFYNPAPGKADWDIEDACSDACFERADAEVVS